MTRTRLSVRSVEFTSEAEQDCAIRVRLLDGDTGLAVELRPCSVLNDDFYTSFDLSRRDATNLIEALQAFILYVEESTNGN